MAIAICFHCGDRKRSPNQACPTCRVLPSSDEEIGLSYMLTDQIMSAEKLSEASRYIKSGKKIALPPEVRAAIFAGLAASRREKREKEKKEASLRKILLGAGVLLVVLFFVFVSPWFQYQLASRTDTLETYRKFAQRYPNSEYTSAARERIRILDEENVWTRAIDGQGISAFRTYVATYPDGKYLDIAKKQIVAFADECWRTVRQSRSEIDILNYLKDYPESSKIAEANDKLQNLYNDIQWVKSQDKIEHYKRFVSRFENHPEKQAIEKRIVPS
jgi:hypothetical protein